MNKYKMSSYFSLFCLFFYLGCISFGGPTAHIALFQQELIEKRKWMNTQQYLQLVAICQFLPGPSSSQVGMILGFYQCGYLGAFLAWLGFTLPSAILLAAIGIGLMHIDLALMSNALQGLKIAACAIVSYAIFTMIKALPQNYLTYIGLLLVSMLCGYTGLVIGQWIWILCGALLGIIFLKEEAPKCKALNIKISQYIAYGALMTLIVIWGALLLCAHSNVYAQLAYIFYRAGALVFGGGHVVLPLLQHDIVAGGLIDSSLFTAGYGIVQAMPGPLFNFASYLGTVLLPKQPVVGALLASVMIFLSGALIAFGCLPLIQKILHIEWLQRAILGINIAVIGILIATLLDPMLMHSVDGVFDILLLMGLFILLYLKKLPILLLVIFSAVFYHFYFF